jgi:hypothetical protein
MSGALTSSLLACAVLGVNPGELYERLTLEAPLKPGKAGRPRRQVPKPDAGIGEPAQCSLCGPVGIVEIRDNPFQVFCQQCGINGPKTESRAFAINLWNRMTIQLRP